MQRAITLSPSSSASQSPSPSPFPSIPSSSNTISQKKKKEPEMASHTLFLFLLLSLAFQLFVSLPEDYYHECTTVPYSCGGLHLNVSYPFLIDHRPGYCGHPDFLLSCINDNTTLMITINETRYQVKDIDYPNELLTVVDTNFVGQTCPHTYQNTTLDPSLFRLSDHDLNLSLYFNCTSLLLDIPTLYDIACLKAIFGKHSYYRLDNQSLSDFTGTCLSTAVVPLDRYAAEQLWNVGANLTAALQQGFSLNWIPGSDWCSGCTNSGGICGYNSSSPPEHTCFCSNFTGTDSCNSPGKHNPRTKEIEIGVIAASASVLFVCLLSFLYCQGCKKSQGSIIFWKKRSSNVQKVEAFLEKYGSLAPRRYRYSDVKKITKSFKYKLGQGGYGTVFKGNFLDGRPVAVKILNDAKGNGEEFVNEVASIGKTSHVNVVKLLGFCSERSKRALIYDFMPNGSLEKFIYIDRTRGETPLGWEKLYEIAVGIAHGLEYLHRGCNARIVHFDIKPHNILLDQDFCPKISDFGLAKLCRTKESIVSMTGARGTVGYIAPEVFSRNFGTVSCKSDVYSFGMMLLEMAGGRRNIDASVENASEIYFPHWIYDHLEHDVDLEACGITSETAEIARKMILVGLWCIQMMPENRPSMNKVVDMLEGSIRDLQMPPKP